MSDDNGEGRGDEELRSYLQGRIPAPGDAYWDDIDARLTAVEGDALVGFSPHDDANHREDADTDAVLVRPTAMNTRDEQTSDTKTGDSRGSRFGGQALLIAAALVLFVGLGAFALMNRGSDEGLEVATASDEDTSATSAAVPAGSAAEAGTIQEGSAASPLDALQIALAGEGDIGLPFNGPYCFTSPNAFLFPGSEEDAAADSPDTPALVWMTIASDGLITFYGLQRDDIVVGGSGYIDSTGEGMLDTKSIVGGTGTFLIGFTVRDASILYGFQHELGLVDCETVSDRVTLLLESVNLSGANLAGGDSPSVARPVPVSADWPPAEAVLSSAGLGEIRIGMTLSELSAVVGTELDFETIGPKVAGECGQVSDSDALSNDIWILVEATGETDAIIRRVSVFDSRWLTPSGAFVGMSEQDILDTFPGQIVSEPHIYVEGTYLTYQPTNAGDPNTVQFVNEGGTITEIRAGDRADGRGWVGLAEGCA